MDNHSQSCSPTSSPPIHIHTSHVYINPLITVLSHIPHLIPNFPSRNHEGKRNFFLYLLLLLLAVLTTAGTGLPFACDPRDSATHTLPFCRTDLRIDERVKDLIGRLTLQEKVKLLANNAAAVPRLGIKAYEWWSEALHGVSNVGPGTKFGGEFPGATSFPQVITTAASFNASLWEEIGKVVSDEARAMYNGGMGGLTYWSPNVNIFRDPRWGRGQETPGEDPVVAAKYAASYVRGSTLMQRYRMSSHSLLRCAHSTGHVSQQDIKDTFDIPFRSCVMEGKVASVMCSYNQVNGVPTCADPKLLRGTVRGSWRLDGYIVSDCDSVGVFYDNQHYTSTPEEAVADAIKAGLDLDCGPFLSVHTENAVQRGLLNEADINLALYNTITVQMRLGMFDGEPSAQPYGNLGPKDVCTPAHQELALEAARQGIVLLKNEGSVLPLSPRRHHPYAVIGPNSDVTVTMIGNYAGVACGYTTPLQGISTYSRTIHQPGCADVACADDALFGGAIQAARRADATIMVMGLDQSIEAEFRDRAGLMLPGRQQELISKVSAASKGPTILVLMSGGPIDISFAKNDPRIAAVLWVGYPGQAGGAAIADVLFGTHNPGGKLPMTWYPQEYLNNLPMTTMDMRSDPSRNYPGRTYRFYKGPVVYPFGHGMSYTSFIHTIADAPKAITCCKRGCEKHGFKRWLPHVAGLLNATKGTWGAPQTTYHVRESKGGCGGQERVPIKIHVCKYLSVVDGAGVRRIPMGEHALHIGDTRHAISLEAQTLGVIKS
ncbi:UNVERIFIED_CONTAM: putative beta-D-xylosidase 2 [Sesamum latifolium]|uniref:Beta-D-xylosidase 2 n=1 Tax=Sesamum latifolium TaxID=2727402 RepID=A0AAW2Y229_9LAMI